MAKPARYFPVEALPFRMRAGLQRFGNDFGNGAADGCFFQWDEQSPRYLSAKRRCLDEYPQRFVMASEALPVLRHVAHWMAQRYSAERASGEGADATLATACPEALDAEELRGFFVRFARAVPEDFVIVQRPPGQTERIVQGTVCFPSGWRPECVLGHDFAALHAPVPEFQEVRTRSTALVDAMLSRGPYVRFVWSVVPDDELDRHPDRPLSAWSRSPSDGYLRVERQVSVPFAKHGAALFLIRLYVYPMGSLTDSQRHTLARALELMPDTIRRYKGLDRAWSPLARQLRCGL